MVLLVVGNAHLPGSADNYGGTLLFPRDLYSLPNMDTFESAMSPYGTSGRIVSDFSMPTDVNTIGATLFYFAIINRSLSTLDITLNFDYLRVGYTDFTNYITLVEKKSVSASFSSVPSGDRRVAMFAEFNTSPVTIPAGTFIYYEFSVVPNTYGVNMISVPDDPKYIMGVWVPIRYTV